MGQSSNQPSHPSLAPARAWPAFPKDRFDQVRAGDPEALGEFFDHYFPRIFATVHRLVGQRAIAEDVTQDVFLRLQRTIRRVDGSRDLAPWLFTVCVNACRDHWRSRWWRMAKQSVSISDHAIASSLLSHEPDPIESVLVQERKSRVNAALQRLPDALREAVVLHDCDGLGHAQIASIAGISHAAARKRHSRALRILADLLREKVGT